MLSQLISQEINNKSITDDIATLENLLNKYNTLVFEMSMTSQSHDKEYILVRTDVFNELRNHRRDASIVHSKVIEKYKEDE